MTSILTAVAWPYANGPRHIGHVSGFGVPSDVFARYMRMQGHDVLMVSGTDEHGTPISVQADQEGVTPRQLADKYNRVIVEDLQGLGLSYDLFTRTTTLNHYRVVQDIFTALYQNGYAVAKEQLSAISPSTGRTLPDRFIEGTCPICGYDGARGDQCDNCGNQLDPEDLINPRSKINGETPEFVQSEQFFLDLPKFTLTLGSWLQTRADWRPNVLKFSANLLEDLRPRAITRDLDWGIPIPLPGWRENPMKRLYVW
ncbi:MAG: class I tRNA ligase family protein, partial [Propionibacteriaceae bacterium]|nr:class I tRNA ligase family protein [Propionibacteriaceae bacterium]